MRERVSCLSMHPSHASQRHPAPALAISSDKRLHLHPRARRSPSRTMATTSARTHGHQQPYAPGLQDEPLRRMRGLDAKSALRASPRASTVATAAVLVPLGAALLGASGLALAVTLTGLALAAPLLVLFSPVLVPAAVATALAVAGLLASGAHGVAGVSALAWAIRYFWRDGRRGHGTVTGMVVQPLEHGEKQSGAGGPAAFVGHRPRDADVPRT